MKIKPIIAVLKKKTCPASKCISGTQASSNKGKVMAGIFNLSFKQIAANPNSEKKAYSSPV